MSGHKQIDIATMPRSYDEIKINVNQQTELTTDSLVENTVPLIKNESKHPHIYVLAGAAAGVMEHCVMYPIDSVKTRMQSLRPHPNASYTSIRHALSQIMKTEGIMRPVRGVSIVALGAGPSHALYFGSYELTKKLLGKKDVINQSVYVNATAGLVATIFHDGTMNPVEVIKQRVQMYNSPYRGVFDCARTVLKTEGVGAFYRSFTTQLSMNVPFQCIHFVSYELMREFLNPTGGYNPKTHLLAGAIAGGLAAAVTTPLDVAKTLLNTQEERVVSESVVIKSKLAKTNRTFVSGMFNALKTIYTLQGVTGFFRGLQPRVVYQVPSCAISWSVYEFFKHYLSLNISDEDLMELTV